MSHWCCPLCIHGGLAPGKDLSLDGTGWNRVHRAGAGEDLGFYMDIKCE